MKSRRRIASPKAKDRVNVGLQHGRSNQEIATGGIWAIGQFAQQQSRAAHVSSGVDHAAHKTSGRAVPVLTSCTSLSSDRDAAYRLHDEGHAEPPHDVYGEIVIGRFIESLIWSSPQRQL
jgi:hypothetical protein